VGRNGQLVAGHGGVLRADCDVSVIKAIITGSTGLVGTAIVAALRAQNVEIVYGYNRSRGNDVVNYDQVQRHFAAIGKFDLLINCAGISYNGPFQQATEYDWTRQVQVNLIGVMNCCHAAVPYIGGGDIINIASLAGVTPHPTLAAYSASKAGVIAFSDALAQDFSALDIRVGCISPGKVGPNGARPSCIARAVIEMWYTQRPNPLGHRVILKE
jgi:NAD(P)-dependent dehydrogenase (short-subunit alcohol dehydrogenase family)